ncbi:MAG TPA: hypothetical protein VNE17_09625 [Nitrolancea sp.]|nr:hypothetical protein [Nitrolancea sp.]
MRRHVVLRRAIVIVALSGALLALQQAALSDSNANVLVASCTAPPLGPNLGDNAGTWAIRPRLGVTSPPTYTERDAHDYVERSGPWNPAYHAPTPTISDVQFVTAQAACGVIGQRINRPDNATVCLVTLRGNFAILGPPRVAYVGKTEYLVFDAASGNLIGIALR